MIYSLCAIIATLAFTIAVIHLVSTLKQIGRSAQALEQFLAHADETAVMVNQSAKKVSSFASGLDVFTGKTVPLIASLALILKNYLFKKKRKGGGA